MITFVDGPLHGTEREMDDRLIFGATAVGSLGCTVFISEVPAWTGVWTHTYAVYDIYGEKALFCKLFDILHAHPYVYGKPCHCTEPGF